MSKKPLTPPKMRGIEDILTVKVPEEKAAVTVSIHKIQLHPKQPRRYFDPEKLEELSRSIKELGILEPLLVRKLAHGNYELIAGERRYRAAQLAGLNEVPVVVHQMDDVTVIKVQLIENLQREDLNPIEETEGILELLGVELGVNSQEVISILNYVANAKKRNLELTENVFRQLETIESVLLSVGKFTAESFRVSRIPLLNLPDDISDALHQGRLEYTKARILARIKDGQLRQQLLAEVLSHNLSLNEIKTKIKTSTQPSQPSTVSIKDRFDGTCRRVKKSKIWDDPKKKQKLEKLLSQLEELIEDNNPR